jgi:glycosyltransferase involved in cell wall biosynthesis
MEKKSKIKKVLLLGKLPPPYIGTSVWMDILINSNLKSYFHLQHINTNIHETLSFGIVSIGNILKNLAIYWRLTWKITRFRPHLVLIPISQSTRGFLKDSIFIIICKLFARKTLIILHGSNLNNWLDSSAKLTQWYVKTIIRMNTGGIVLGNNLIKIFARYFAEENIFVVPNGIDHKYRLMEKRDKKNSGEVKLLFLGNLQPTKGIVEIIHSLCLLDDGIRKRIVLEVVGVFRDEDTKSRCMEMVEGERLPVVFKGPLYNDEKIAALANADIFVFTPNAPEGHPLVILEAMAAGLPVISTDQGAIVESVIHEKNGFIVEPRNPVQIAEKIKFLIENPGIREKMGAESRKRYLENFTEEKMVERLQAVFETVLTHG